MALSLRFLLSPTHTPAQHMHAVLPYAHWWSHQRTNDGTFRTVHFPDVVPRLGGRFAFEEGDFLHMTPPEPASRWQPPSPYATGELPPPPYEALGADAGGNLGLGLGISAPHEAGDYLSVDTAAGAPGYDVLVTLFFLDTSPNVLATLQQIHRLLRPGGTWLNLGPLLWPGGAQALAAHGRVRVYGRLAGDDALDLPRGVLGCAQDLVAHSGRRRTPTLLHSW
jgi:hypothetical protein